MFRTPEPGADRGHPERGTGSNPSRGRTGIPALLLLLCITAAGYGQFAEPALQFFREDLTFTLEADPDRVSGSLDVILNVDGIYSFRNTAHREQTVQILYPFPADSHCGAVLDARATCLPSGQDLPFSRLDSLGLRFPLTLPEASEQLVRIRYRQHMADGVLRYILQTTQGWGRALESASFSLEIPDTLRLDSLSYPADGLRQREHSAVYYWQVHDFLPRWDFVARFGRRKTR